MPRYRLGRHARFVTAKKTFLSKASSIVFALAFLFEACEARPDANGSSPQAADEANSTGSAPSGPLRKSPENRGTARPAVPRPIDRLPKDGDEFNRLVFESSPYLQHARNPIDWRPWGPEAFEEAARLDKPVFLSIGYTTCHWCHVMEHESFEDEEVAALMNKHYVCIKVDREERPDVDNVYMTVTQMMTGRGGWPMTVIMSPEKIPFFAGTYFPKSSMMQLLPHFSTVWQKERPKVAEVGQAIMKSSGNFSPASRGRPERNQPRCLLPIAPR